MERPVSSHGRSRAARQIARVGRNKRSAITSIKLLQRTKLCCSELPANDVMRRFKAPQPFLLLLRVPILCLCHAFVTYFTATVSINFGLDNCCRRPTFGLIIKEMIASTSEFTELGEKNLVLRKSKKSWRKHSPELNSF
ncbi:hypothetical protein EVAR_74998_1 [Eumeta japonica]|uniref:Uncharacterized protein n=1 Tax=Eumeta variegata TaxID=151549 RepID=A0A4C1VAF6_EUMVA|nr:hypothetical protein EVAR_74998_1 [Eumeta japonica]